ncbi:MAG TPA: efflux RND transporter permease subunit [Chromatiales bacterium]|nr:efflux RND transporter permease subunit [Thiotrichales bacterium]HIP68194.1 efflux RND transporter permease subunit [Chromatiales bacterium]
MTESRMGISGRIAQKFQTSEITPLLALVGLLLGLFAVLVTPREEEPQINVTFANIFIAYPGATASEVESLVSSPAEQVLSEIVGIDHVYSSSYPGMSVLTIQYKVGQDRTAALVRLYNKLESNQDWLPPNVGVSQPIVKPKGIDDVPIVSATLWTDDPDRGAADLLKVAHALETQLKRVPGTRDIYTIGGPDNVVSVTLDPQRMGGFGIALNDLRNALLAANTSRDAATVVNNNEEIQIQAGSFLTSAEEIADLIVGVHEGRPVRLEDVASIRYGADQPERYVEYRTGVGYHGEHATHAVPAVTLVVAKKPGTNAVKIANRVIKRFEQLEGIFIPEGVHVEITRDYGKTADSKANKLVQKLMFATLSVVLLVWFAMGWREALIVGVAVVITLLITLFASWAWGFTLNRVSLFALIFSIGILVDDAIVVVENIHRHMQMGGRKLLETIPVAVDEVGGPTILATFTVIAALLPMAFVTGLMGPYMSPIPINASLGMIISLAVAYVVTPWLTYKVMRKVDFSHHTGDGVPAWLQKMFDVMVGSFLGESGKKRGLLFLVITLLIAMAVSLAVFKVVVLKMLPFDNKSEFQIVVDMPEGTSLEMTKRVLDEVSELVVQVPEVSDVQLYAGTAAPINFNGLVRQYYLREGAHLGDLQVNLTDKHHRKRKSHEIALDVRAQLDLVAQRHPGAKIKVVEVPPGPPVMSPIVAEIYGLDYKQQTDVARQVQQVFAETADIVDIDDSVEAESSRYVLHVDRQKAALLGLSQQAVATAVDSVLRGDDVSYLHGSHIKYAVPIRVEFSTADKADIDNILTLKIRSRSGQLVPMTEIVTVEKGVREQGRHHKDLLPVVYVTADMVGEIDSPLYGMFEVSSKLKDKTLKQGGHIEQFFINQPDSPYQYSLKWDGEWKVTYETFRDMGLAYAVGMILIYLLVVAQFKSYMVPLVIMAPIPLTIIGVMPGHALLDAKFTATSMIGMIALAGIIVRNSILLVDFINDQVRSGMPLKKAVVKSGAVRAKPIVLTGAAAMLGAFFIIDDPIFSGLAIALIFGIFVSTLLTLVVIPILYYLYAKSRMNIILGEEEA